MAESEVKVLGVWASPFVLRPRIALNIKDVKYEFIEENMQSKSKLLLKSNPVYKKVPVLVHGDKPISESLNIVEYIDEAWSSGPSILPSDPYDRALERFWVAFINDKWSATIKGIDIADGEEAKKAAVDQVVEILVLLEEAFKKCSKGKAFFGGDRIGYVDIAFGCYLGWLRVREKHHEVTLLDQAKTPELVKWVERFSEHPAVVGVMPELEKLGEFAKGVFAKMRAAANLPPK
ncbi:hypothetical protein FNV43_RR26109 [Rhamnella rubrinervis]|uniref:glutathione transferase n=1 Tax=Rhamnella rubrinervis TaxID=2594499 RepID=A0A8K0DLY9_9ROSA|nr:hypothetical protein FNV43_RR26109 [Rhamnella rubrinervis]